MDHRDQLELGMRSDSRFKAIIRFSLSRPLSSAIFRAAFLSSSSFSIRVHNCSSLISKEPVSRFLLSLSLKISSMLWLAVVIKLEVDFLPALEGLINENMVFSFDRFHS